jgi:hypothetical protein
MDAPPHWFFPLDQSASLTWRVLGTAMLVGGLVALCTRRWPRVRRSSIGIVGVALGAWGMLYLTRPAWQRAAFAGSASPPVMVVEPFTRVAPGVEVGQIDLRSGDEDIESVALVRLDPALHSFRVVHDPTTPSTIEQWRDRLAAVAVVNGSYFMPDRSPQTPLRQDGRELGPTTYSSSHGAFVADPDRGTATIVDLKDVTLPLGLRPFPQAMVSYPLLLAADGSHRVTTNTDWVASRTFVGVDSQGWIVLGTSKHGYFTLRRLAAFVHDAPIGLVTALNFDGGPIAAQAVKAGDYERVVIGDAETNAGVDLLRARIQAMRKPGVPLPIVLAALPK